MAGATLLVAGSPAFADPPQLTVSESSFDFGDVVVSQTATHHFTITNNGTTPATTNSASAVNFAEFGFPLNDTCAGTVLAAGASCGFDERFRPQSVGPASGSLTLHYDVGDVTVDLSGTGTPQLTVSESSFDFGDVVVSQTATHHFTITNNGTTPATTFSVFTTTLGFGFVTDTCFAQLLPAGASCGFDATFEPQSAGPASGSLIAHYDVGDVTVDLAGTGASPLAITTASLPAGTVGAAYPATDLQTTGGTPPSHWSVTGGSLPPGLTLDPSTGALAGTPTGSGVYTVTVTATDSGSPTPQTATQAFSITITGFADLAASITGPPAPTPQAKPITYTISVANHGPDSTHASLTDPLPAASRFTALTSRAGTCQTPPAEATGTIVCALGTVNPGSTATVTVSITPTAKKVTLSTTATVTPDANTTDTVSANNSASATFQIK
ncbi:MAG: choice-of-anchor D domain-containing protein [Mycobacterium sp.]|nr:choice-of-anchor D domain-containing protein [Mycobacterium sp.]